MANFANLTAKLNLNMQDFATNMRKASGIADKFSADMQGKINSGMVEPAKQSKFEFKDVARIVQGIIISKVFYSGLNAIRQATSAVWEFSKELEYAKMVYSNLFGDPRLATEFINVLKDFAAITPFTFKQSEQAAKRLLAYGIEYQNIMYVMRGVLAAATVQGNDAIIEPISRALGQIYTKGRLMNEEMRQLAEAGIPVYEILQEKLGLTTEELRNLGRTAVPAEKAINALIDGINERFGSTLDQANSTTMGILSNIKDNTMMLFAGLFEPMAENFKEKIGGMGAFIKSLLDTFELKGIGGVFEQLVPPAAREAVKDLIGLFKMLGDYVKANLSSALNILTYLLIGIGHAANLLGPPLMMVLGTFSALIKAVTDQAALMTILTPVILGGAMAWVIFKMHAIAALVTTKVIGLITKATMGLISALSFLVMHPVWALLAFGVGLFVALSGASEGFRKSISNLYKGMFRMGGVDTDTMLLPDSKERAADLGKFNKALDGTSGSMDDLAKSTGAAAKAAKGLLGFDEVFSLKAPDEGNAGPDLSGLVDDLGDFGALDFSGVEMELPNVEDIASNFIDNLIAAFGGQEAVLSTGLGAILGAALGGVLGGPLGAKIGLVAGAIAGRLWVEIAKALDLTDAGAVAIPIATTLGAIIGNMAGGPLGALIGAGIGTLVGWIIDSIARGFQTGDWSSLALPVGIGLGAGIGMLVGGPAGALIGAGIGALIGWVGEQLIKNWASIEGWFEGLGPWFEGLGDAIGGFFSGALEGIGEFFGGALTDADNFFSGMWDKVNEGSDGLLQPFTDAWDNGVNIVSTVMDEIGLAVSEEFSGIIKGFDTIRKDIGDALTKVGEDMHLAMTTATDRIGKTVGGVFDLIVDLAVKFGGELWDAISEKFSAVYDVIAEKVEAAWLVVSEWFQGIWDVVSEKLSSVWDTVSEWFQGIWDVIEEKVRGAWESVSDWFEGMWTTVKFVLDKIFLVVRVIFSNIVAVIKERVVGIYDSVKTTFTNVYETIKSRISNMYSTVKDGLKNIYKSFTDWIKDLWNNVFGKFFDWIDDGVAKLRDFFKLDAKASQPTRYVAPSTRNLAQHATGGVFNREHIARFAEGNKAEAIIPLENSSAMQPFVDAVANGLTAALMPMVAAVSGQGSQMQPLYVGTLIGDERSLKELARKVTIMQIEEESRRG